MISQADERHLPWDRGEQETSQLDVCMLGLYTTMSTKLQKGNPELVVALKGGRRKAWLQTHRCFYLVVGFLYYFMVSSSLGIMQPAPLVFLKPSLSNCGFFSQEVNITALNLLCPLEHRRPCSLRGAATGGTACACLLSIQYYTFLEGTHCIFQFYCEVYNQQSKILRQLNRTEEN